MSTNLYYRPHAPRTKTHLPAALKWALSKRLWEHDGSLCGDSVVLTVADDHYAFLEGLEAADLEGAKELRQALVEYGAVEVWIGE